MFGFSRILCYGGNIELRDIGEGVVLRLNDKLISCGDLELKKEVRVVGLRFVSLQIIIEDKEIGNVIQNVKEFKINILKEFF